MIELADSPYNRLVEETREAYSGADRRKAINDFNAHVKAHPGIIAEQDIQKRPWEK